MDLSPESLSLLPLDDLAYRIATCTDPQSQEEIACSLGASCYDPELRAFTALLSKSQQGVITEALLQNLPVLPAENHQHILAGIAAAIDGYYTDFAVFTNAIAAQAASPLLDPLVIPLLRRAEFCVALLTSFQMLRRTLPPPWLTAIRQRRDRSDFVETSLDLVYSLQRLDALIK